MWSEVDDSVRLSLFSWNRDCKSRSGVRDLGSSSFRGILIGSLRISLGDLGPFMDSNLSLKSLKY